MEEYLSTIADNLNAAGKELVLKAAFFVATADHEYHEKERNLLTSLAQALGMSERHSGGILTSLLVDQLCDP